MNCLDRLSGQHRVPFGDLGAGLAPRPPHGAEDFDLPPNPNIAALVDKGIAPTWPFRAREGEPFRRDLVHRIPYPPTRARSGDQRLQVLPALFPKAN